VALLICCIARNTAHVRDQYPAFSNCTVRLVSFRVVSISACSWPFQDSCFFRKFHPPLVIVRPCPGSRHCVRPFVVMILVLYTRSSRAHTFDESRILTKPPLESLGPETKSLKSPVAFLAHEGGEGHMQLLVSRALPSACFYA